jgi:hypothetical protein
MVSNYSQSGTLQYSNVTSGYRYVWNDYTNQTSVFSGGAVVTRRPNVKIRTQSQQVATISMPVTPINFGSVIPNESHVESVSIQNTGSLLLAGYIQCPAGFSIEASRASAPTAKAVIEPDIDRLGYRFTVESGSSMSFDIRFSPESEGQYSGNVVVTSNADNNPVLNIPVSGSCSPGTLDTPIPSIVYSGSSITLEWDAIPNATAYKVYKSDTPDGTFTLLGTTTTPEYTDVAGDKGFYYIVATQGVPAKQSKK